MHLPLRQLKHKMESQRVLEECCMHDQNPHLEKQSDHILCFSCAGNETNWKNIDTDVHICISAVGRVEIQIEI